MKDQIIKDNMKRIERLKKVLQNLKEMRNILDNFIELKKIEIDELNQKNESLNDKIKEDLSDDEDDNGPIVWMR